MEITQKVAENIIESRVIIEEAMTPYKGVEVTYVGFTDAEGEQFLWNDEDGDPDPSRPFAIVSFNAMNLHLLEQSVDEYQAGMYDECVNHNLSVRMDADKARELSKGTPGTLICHNVHLKDEDGELMYDEKTEEPVMGLLVKSFAPVAAKFAKKASLADILAKRAPKEEPKAVPEKKVKITA
jgi:hypothetical protein